MIDFPFDVCYTEIGRTDLRALLKALAKETGCRVELRQIKAE